MFFRRKFNVKVGVSYIKNAHVNEQARGCGEVLSIEQGRGTFFNLIITIFTCHVSDVIRRGAHIP